MLQMNVRSTLGRVTMRLRDWRFRKRVFTSVQVTSAHEPQSPVPAAYMPLYAYLDRRYAVRVVLTFEQIEALLGFTPPSPAFADAEWWTRSQGTTNHYSAAWTAARRTAAPQLSARIVAFERLP
jgi:hypothetical protein